jgi:hypothetical protein
MEAVARYALWVRRHLEGKHGGREAARRGLEEMPEVQAVLDTNLDPAGTGSVAVRAVYGQWFPWLLMLDPAWALSNWEGIFAPGASAEELAEAAWNRYLAVTPAFDQVFELLSEEYRRAVAAAVAGGDDEALTRPSQGLAEHLTALYLRGRIPLEDGMLADFFARAPQPQRAHALAYAGQMLQRQPDRIPAEIGRRLQQLWESRLESGRGAAAGAGHEQELAQFGWWFASGKLDGPWSVRQLVALLELTGQVANTSKVVEHLKAFMDTMPYEVVRCIAALIDRERGAITILGWGQDAQQMLSRIVGSSDSGARDLALDLLNTFDLQPVTDLIRWS